ncbi:MAG: hypothetical protein OD918_01130 [Gammaproteobacteria bacterium]
MASHVISLGLGAGVAWLWLVLVPVSGWLVLKSRFFRRFMWETSGYDRYFLIVSAGIGMLIAGGAVSGWISAWALQPSVTPADIWEFPLHENKETAYAAVRLSLFWSAPLALVLGALIFCVSLLFWEEKIRTQRLDFLAKKNGVLDFVVQASRKESLTMLTISNRKLYVGWPQRVSDWDNPDPSKQYLYFLPFMSGSRNKDSLEIEITTNYSKPHILLMEEEVGEEELEILVPVHEIVHMQPFDPDMYEHHATPFLPPESGR